MAQPSKRAGDRFVVTVLLAAAGSVEGRNVCDHKAVLVSLSESWIAERPMNHLIDHFIELATRIGHWGYLLVFVVVVLECQALLGLFMPGESLVLAAGFLAGQDVFELKLLIPVVALAAIVGDSVGYELGRHLGRDWLRRHGGRVGIREHHFDRIDRFIARHGGKSVFASHFLHLFRALMPFIAGSNAMPYRRFFVFNAVGCVLWAAVFTTLGYFFGASWNVIEKWIGRGGAIVGAVIVLVFVIIRLWTWLTQHEVEFRQRWAVFVSRPGMLAFRHRFSRQIEFAERRLSPGGYLGLHLTLGVVVVLLAGWAFGGISEDVVTNEPLVALDRTIAGWFNAHATPAVTNAARAVTFLGSTSCLVPLSLAFAAWQIRRKAWHRLLALVLAVGGGVLLGLVLKQLFHRDRPVLPHPLVELASYGFPSGHTIGATLFYGLAAFYLVQDATAWRWRVLAPLLASLLIGLIGFSRIYLGAHFFSDVLGAMAVGAMWLTACVTAVEIRRRYREGQPHVVPS
jgi:membrane protein DedA with SNARE-associated domain/membrane-associated phospholipid phosphatase